MKRVGLMPSVHDLGRTPRSRRHPLLLQGPLARTETQVALLELARRLVNPRLVTDPPPYRPNPVLRGPRHLVVEYDAVAPAAQEAVRTGSPGLSA